MLKTPMCGRESEGEVVFAIEEMIGHPKTWPAWIKDIFFLRKLNRTNRLNIITFTLGNGLPPHVLHQWIAVRQVECDKAKFNVDLEAVLQSMTLDPDNKLAQKYFYFDLVLQEYCFMNGIPRNALTRGLKGPRERQPPGPFATPPQHWPVFCATQKTGAPHGGVAAPPLQPPPSIGPSLICAT